LFPVPQDLDHREELIRDLESQVECMRSEQERLKRNGEDELEQLNAVIDKLQQELANIEQKLPPHDEEEVDGVMVENLKVDIAAQRAEDDLAVATSEDLSRTKQRLEAPTADTMTQTEEEAGREEEEEEQRSHAARQEDALRERTASLVVLQAQVQALEQSATSRVEELRSRIQELESAAGEKDAELARCQRLLEGAQSEAEALQGKVDHLEDQLRATLASALVSRAQLDALQEPQEQQHDHRQTKEEEDRDLQSQPTGPLDQVLEIGDSGIPQLDFFSRPPSGARGSAAVWGGGGSSGKVGHLTEKLRELEVGLNSVQKDQELQQLLSSSEEEVLEYEKRLAVLMDLLNQMKGRSGAAAQHHTWAPTSQVRLYCGGNCGLNLNARSLPVGVLEQDTLEQVLLMKNLYRRQNVLRQTLKTTPTRWENN